jgi:uncharacterized delta-60 repeat protein
MRRITISLVTACVLLAGRPAIAAPGDLDASFSGDGIATAFTDGSVATAVGIDPDGRIVVGGYTLRGGVDVAIARFLPDGTRDAAFGGGDGRIRIDVGANDYGLDIVVLPDGAIAVTGVSLDADGGQDRPFVARVGPRGAPTAAFGGDGIAFVDFERPSQTTNAIAATPRGRLVVGGFMSNGTTTRTAVARLLLDGRLDRGFSGDGRVMLDLSDGSEAVHDLLVLPDGRIVLAGEADVGLQPRFLLARLLADGSLDTGFGLSRGRTLTDVAPGADAALALTRDRDGAYVLAGRAADEGRNDWAVARYGIRGRPDATFAGDGSTVVRLTDAAEEAADVVAQGRRLLVVGRIRRAGTMDLAVARLKNGGALDPTFGGGDGIATVDVAGSTDAGRGIALQPNGKIVATGETWVDRTPRFLVVRLRTT